MYRTTKKERLSIVIEFEYLHKKFGEFTEEDLVSSVKDLIVGSGSYSSNAGFKITDVKPKKKRKV
jgi:hypothetical protein